MFLDHLTIQEKSKNSTKSTIRTQIKNNYLIPRTNNIELHTEQGKTSNGSLWLSDNIHLPKYVNRYKILTESRIHTYSIINENGRKCLTDLLYPKFIPNGKPATFLSRPEKKIFATIGNDIIVSCTVSGYPRPKG